MIPKLRPVQNPHDIGDSFYKIAVANVLYFLKIWYYTSFHDPILSGTSVAPTSKIHMPAMLVLSVV
jgi:hypothetical protein